MRRTHLSAFAIIAALAALGASTARAQQGLDIYYVDVMGGAATLIVTPERESILIDSGWPGFDDRDPKRIEHVLKDVAGLDHLDHLVTTHWHIDHFGGVEGLAKRLEIRNFWDRGLPEDELAGLDFPEGPPAGEGLGKAYRAASAGKRKPLLAGGTLPLKGNVKATVVASGGKVDSHTEATAGHPNETCAADIPDKEVDPSDNARSLAIVFRLGDFDFLDCGDLTWNIEKSLVCPIDRVRASAPSGQTPGAVDLYQVTHHGLDISNHPLLLKTIAPTVAIMNNGPRKGGSPATVRLLKSLPSLQALYAVHKNETTGPEDNADPALTANSNGKSGQFIHVHVEPDGSRYSVKIGPDGEPKTFTAR